MAVYLTGESTFSLQRIREQKATPGLVHLFGIVDSHAEARNHEEFADVLAVSGYFPLFLPKSLERIAGSKNAQNLVDWLETNIVPIFSDVEVGKGEFNRVEDRNRKLVAKLLEFARLVGEDPYWVFPEQSLWVKYPCIDEVFCFTNSVELLSAYYLRRLATVLEHVDQDTFSKYAVHCDCSSPDRECSSGACPEVLGAAWPDWLNFPKLTSGEPDFRILSGRKRLAWSVMCCLATLGVIGKTWGSESLSSFAHKVVVMYGALFFVRDDEDVQWVWEHCESGYGVDCVDAEVIV